MRKRKVMENEEYDYIIVGGGSAGCTLANRLTEDPSTTVLLLEAGGKDTNPWIHIPVGYVKTLDMPSLNWRFETEPEANTYNRAIPIPRGKVLGGSSSINGMVYVRGQPLDYDTWSQLGNRGWSYDSVLPYFKKSENQNPFCPKCWQGPDQQETNPPDPRSCHFRQLLSMDLKNAKK